MAEFWITNLEASNFTFEGILFERRKGYEEGIKKRGYFEHLLTFHAVADDKLSIEPIIHSGNLLAVIDDLCLLLSLAQSRHVACPEYELEGRKINRSYVLGKPSGSKIINEYKLGSFLETAVETIRQPDWVSKTGFVPAFYFVLDRNLDEAVEFEFISSWISLEILSNAYALQNNSKSKADKIPVRQKVIDLKNEYKLGFITEQLIDEYKEVRNHLMHTGTYGKIEKHRVGELSIRLKASVQLVLVTLLGCKDYVWDLQGWNVWISQKKNLNSTRGEEY